MNASAHLTVAVTAVQDDRPLFDRTERAARQWLDVLDERQFSVTRLVGAQPRKAIMAASADGYDLLVMSVGAPWGIEPHSFALDPKRVFEEGSCSVVLVQQGTASQANPVEVESFAAKEDPLGLSDMLRPSA